MTTPTGTLDLAGVTIVDQHCHATAHTPLIDVNQLRSFCTESRDPRVTLEGVATSVAYLRLVTALAEHLACEATEDAVLAARAERDPIEHAADLYRDEGIAALCLDDGYPPAATAIRPGLIAAAAGLTEVHILRLEPLLERLIIEHSTESGDLDSVQDALSKELATAADGRVRGLKTVAGYRTGLGITPHTAAAVATSWDHARRDASAGSLRLGHKPLLDTLLLHAFAEAGRLGLPVQVHVGYGDTDADLRTANPLELRPVLENPALHETSFVLLHGCWPFVREGGYLAAVYGNVWLDVSYGIPFLSRRELVDTTRAAVGVTPLSRLLYSSDGAMIPELHWMGAREGRHAMATALLETVAAGELTISQAKEAAGLVLGGNARRLYRVDD